MVRTLLMIAGILILVVAVLAVVYALVIRPWMNRYGATDEEVRAVLPSDELISRSVFGHTRAITIEAPASAIWPWLVQIGGDKGGFYSLTWIEKLINCPIVNADRIHPEWQNLKVGDLMKMCPNEPAPPPYTVAAIYPDRGLILGHRAGPNDPVPPGTEWFDTWSFILNPVDENTTRLIIRSRNAGVFAWMHAIAPGQFIMERGMLRGTKKVVEANQP